MTANLHCGSSLHAALANDPAAFARCTFVGYKVEADDVLEIRSCPSCGETLARWIGIGARLAAARALGDTSMVGRCMRALRRDPFTLKIDDSAIRSLIDAVELERIMSLPVRGARPPVVTVSRGPASEARRIGGTP